MSKSRAVGWVLLLTPVAWVPVVAGLKVWWAPLAALGTAASIAAGITLILNSRR